MPCNLIHHGAPGKCNELCHEHDGDKMCIRDRVDTVRTAVEEFAGYLIGKDPARIEDHWQYMYRSGFYRGGPEVMSAIAGIDQALWDIKGKYFNAPIYDLLGGARCV